MEGEQEDIECFILTARQEVFDLFEKHLSSPLAGEGHGEGDENS